MPNVWLKVGGGGGRGGGGAETKRVMLTSECADGGDDPVEDLKEGREGEWPATEGGSARLQCRCVSPFFRDRRRRRGGGDAGHVHANFG